MDMIWDAIDQLQFARNLLEEEDLEIEAEIHSELGEIYYAFLKMETLALENFKISVRIANAMVPRIMSSVPWYKKASQRVQEHQEKIQKQQEAQSQAEYQRILAKYGKELETLLEVLKKDSEKTTKDFVKILYQKHAPKTQPDYKFDDKLDVKKILQNALIHYHPDKNQNQDEKWLFITTEITKYLNFHYSQYTC